MKLYFLRHDIAEEWRQGHSDADRRLTAEGIEEMKAVGRGMRALDLEIDVIVTSPLARACETAALAAEAIQCSQPVRVDRSLACGCTLEDLADLLKDEPEKARILLVGHEPDFSELVSTLIGGGQVRMRKASLACVDLPKVAEGAGELRWLLNAGHLSLIGAD